MRSSNHRASMAVLLGLVGTLAVPGGILLARQTAGISLIDAAWAIPLAAACGVAALLFVRGARGRIRRSLERAGGATRIRTGVVLGVAGICFALSGSIAVGVYELLLRLEK
jgi:ABC-type Fe3+ transport system permease subunit